MAKILNVAGLVVGLSALVVQFALTIPASMEAGRSLAGSVIHYFSYFTILTNILVVLVHLAALLGAPRFFTQAWVRAGVAVSILLVTIVYWQLLSALWQPEGLFLLCDIALHYIAPVIYLVWWLTAGTDGSLSWRHLPLWLAYPLIYVAYVQVRAPIAGEVPYYFLDARLNGWPSVLVYLAAMLLTFAFLGRLAMLADRIIAGGKPARKGDAIAPTRTAS
ncbi:Pr6Pr family membrane protein [Nitratireductor sp. L1-7-SE]|uniref:Pr6Pr family membrane protein n=1 Tax=Nitratireductor rhodophyticola TaxID=2854036 RepID=A0ABS7R3W6_9HYPH|nr:Pr6Pr family membrane protein [Nitratireductor rhodophyticola]MBY8915070.1 Pr6Pr family membrane protein [Nitratireductor rhodophyticola]MBY8919860.1 Pr6Pr family membrane protein [Nitratireductor rhodophyticola]